MSTRNHRSTYKQRLALFALALCGALFCLPTTGAAKTFTVTGTGDTVAVDGKLTLREAICAANGSAPCGDAPAGDATLDLIYFNVPVAPGATAVNISLTAALPPITGAVVIDGYTQPGAHPNTLALGNDAQALIRIFGSSLGGTPNGLTINAPGIVRGLVLIAFKGDGIVINTGGGGSTLSGNFIGILPSGTPGANNGHGIHLVNTSGNVIGGSAPATRNVISGNGSDGIDLDGASGNAINGNYIGVAPNGTTTAANAARGIELTGHADANLIGDAAAGAGNLLSGNAREGIRIAASKDNKVRGNLIGTKADGASPLGNGFEGVALGNGGDNSQIGGPAAGEGNVIAFNGASPASFGDGVSVIAGVGNAILGNSIHTNAGLGIRLASNGNQSAQSAFDVAAINNNGVTSITGVVGTSYNKQYRVEFFVNPQCDTSGFGEGRAFIGARTVQGTGGSLGSVAFNANIPGVHLGQSLAITVTELGENNTSMFTPCVLISAPTPTPTPVPVAATVQFSAPTYTVTEGVSSATITVTRTGNTSGAGTIDFATDDSGVPMNCAVSNGLASDHCDFTTAIGTLKFAPGEVSKVFNVFINDDAHSEGTETANISLRNPTGGFALGLSNATIVINDNDGAANAPNPIDEPAVFVRRQYIDFLNREPDAPGFNAWLGVLTGCGPNNGGINSPPNCDRITVSSGFYGSPEFGERGLFVYRFFEATLGRRPTYREFVRDLSPLSAPQPAAELEANRTAFIAALMSRPEFVNLYAGLTVPAQAAAFVAKLEATAGVQLPEPGRGQLIAQMQGGQQTAAQVLRSFGDAPPVVNRFYNRAFVATEYYGYLRRDPEAAGFNAWLDYLNAHPADARTMVNGFMNSVEYRLRFGQP